MGAEFAIPALIAVALSAVALGVVSLFLRVREVVEAEGDLGAREPSLWFWAWQLIKVLIVVTAAWQAQDLIRVLVK
ncbi:hypothetical protein [Qipengyuania flava]|uniref:hypothetical protein n=1 Tax=Qipengyuania flava TaxID=192812 RepID=UPI000EB84F7B|nr:hypothetical protein [Qipengyuania flava]MCA0890114.1 hypothetical protein [Qipengyuania flava]HCS18891.1 hypothetical protein [Erythrobacter sp.]|tara:strand:+ start:174 stop:401 length:228 start_codon:yes stop_codon:yes gene_type:complete